tara:strand:- start:227 stop:460 length:234 start_codon:yes stop_codon:yes gene_type:complete
MKAESLKHQGWSICPETRFLSYKPSDKSCDITYVSYIEDKELQLIYVVLGLDLWNSVGEDDLLDRNYKYSKKKDRSA